MKVLEFIKENITRLALVFPAVTFRYAFNDKADAHIVELTPEEQFHANKKLDSAWIPIALEFRELFPYDSLVFVSSDSTLAIQKAEFTWNLIQQDIFDFGYYQNIINQVQIANTRMFIDTDAKPEFIGPHFQYLDKVNFSWSEYSNAALIMAAPKSFENSTPESKKQETIVDSEFIAAAA